MTTLFGWDIVRSLLIIRVFDAFSLRNLNLRQRMWLELLKDYNITILYHLGKANVYVDALRRKNSSIGSLVSFIVEEILLARDVRG